MTEYYEKKMHSYSKEAIEKWDRVQCWGFQKIDQYNLTSEKKFRLKYLCRARTLLDFDEMDLSEEDEAEYKDLWREVDAKHHRHLAEIDEDNFNLDFVDI
jgi:hypothetical protein